MHILGANYSSGEHYTGTELWAKQSNNTLSWSEQRTLAFDRIYYLACTVYNRGHEKQSTVLLIASSESFEDDGVNKKHENINIFTYTTQTMKHKT